MRCTDLTGSPIKNSGMVRSGGSILGFFLIFLISTFPPGKGINHEGHEDHEDKTERCIIDRNSEQSVRL